MLYGYITLKQPTVFWEPFAFRKSCRMPVFGLGSPETSQTNQRRVHSNRSFLRSFVENHDDVRSRCRSWKAWLQRRNGSKRPRWLEWSPTFLWKNDGFDEVDGLDGFVSVGWCGGGSCCFGGWKMGDVSGGKKTKPGGFFLFWERCEWYISCDHFF